MAARAPREPAPHAGNIAVDAHYKNTLGVTPRVTPLCGVTPGVIDYSRGVTRERSNCEEESYVIAWTSNCTHFELRITYTRYSVRAPTVHPSNSRELLPGVTPGSYSLGVLGSIKILQAVLCGRLYFLA